jgi:hypothetical protein
MPTSGEMGRLSGYNPPVLRFAKRTPSAFPAVGASHSPADIPQEFGENKEIP